MKAKTWRLLSNLGWYQPLIYEAVHREKEITQKISFCRAEGVLRFSSKSHGPGDLGNLRVRSFQPEITDSTDQGRDHNNLWFAYRIVIYLGITKERIIERDDVRKKTEESRGMREADTISELSCFLFFNIYFFLTLDRIFRNIISKLVISLFLFLYA